LNPKAWVYPRVLAKELGKNNWKEGGQEEGGKIENFNKNGRIKELKDWPTG